MSDFITPTGIIHHLILKADMAYSIFLFSPKSPIILKADIDFFFFLQILNPLINSDRQKLRREIESDKEQLSEANSTLERERMTGNSLRRELDMERDQHRTTERQYKSKVTELRATAETEKARNDELNT